MPPTSSSPTPISPTLISLVCFDLGGVLAHVAHTWSEAADAAGVKYNLPKDHSLTQAPPFEPYQAGQIDTETYVKELANFLQVSEDEATQVHQHILIEPTLGTLAIVQSLNEQGLLTACLSNTNTLHWPELTGPRFPNIQALQIHLASQNLGVSKPDLAIFRKFEEITKTPAERILFFEDTAINIEGAKAASWNVAPINPREPQEPQIAQALRAYGLSA